jgi:hypothetical protein
MPNISTSSFDGGAFPPDIASPIVALGLAGSPFFNNLTRRETSRNSLVFQPSARPGSTGWLNSG